VIRNSKTRRAPQPPLTLEASSEHGHTALACRVNLHNSTSAPAMAIRFRPLTAMASIRSALYDIHSIRNAKRSFGLNRNFHVPRVDRRLVRLSVARSRLPRDRNFRHQPRNGQAASRDSRRGSAATLTQSLGISACAARLDIWAAVGRSVPIADPLHVGPAGLCGAKLKTRPARRTQRLPEPRQQGDSGGIVQVVKEARTDEKVHVGECVDTAAGLCQAKQVLADQLQLRRLDQRGQL